MGASETRRLQAIMFTDIVGFSRMMGEDEERTIRLVEEHRVIVRAALAPNQGREHQTIGDAFVVLFDSALNAVSCAVDIQRRLRERNAGKPESEHVVIRIGIHLDDIVFKDGQIYGDGVNLAARVEPQAEAGGICITEPVLAQVKGKVTFTFVPLGERALKNIARPPALYAVHVAGGPKPGGGQKRQTSPSKAVVAVAGVAIAFVVVAAVAIAAVQVFGARPVSADPRAAARYAEALTLQRDGQPHGAIVALQDALAADPSLAAAQLRLAVLLFDEDPLTARSAYQAAARGRDRLDDKDAGLVTAFAPWFAATVDLAAFAAAMDALASRFDDDDEVLYWQAFAHELLDDHKGARAIVARGAASFLPLRFIDALAVLGEDGGEVEGRQILEQCAAASPSSTRCLLELVSLHLRAGRCGDMERVARELVSRAPADPDAERMLAYALAAQDVPITSVVEVLQRAQRKVPTAAQGISESVHKTRVFAFAGAFAAADEAALQWQAQAAGHPDVFMQVVPATYVVSGRIEQGRTAEAGDAAEAFLRRAPAFQKDALGDDWSPFFANALFVAGRLSSTALEQLRADWVEEQWAKNPRPDRLLRLWRDAWGEWARDPVQAQWAQQAFERMKARGLRLPTTALLEPGLALAVGQTRLLSGDVKGALPFLEHAGTSCVGLMEPYRSTRALYWLGEGRRRSGDNDGARAAWQQIVGRWGATTDRSVTLDAARAGLAALAPP